MNRQIGKWRWACGLAMCSLVGSGVAMAADEAADTAAPKAAAPAEAVDSPANNTPAPAVIAEPSDRAHMHRDMAFRQLSKLESGDVYGNDGKQIGHIKGLAIDTARGRIAYAVVEFDRLADIGDKHFAVPWRALEKKLDEKDFNKITYAMNTDAERLKNSKGIDKNQWPDMAQLKAEDTQTMWGVAPYWAETARTDRKSNKTEADADAKTTDHENARLQGSPVSPERSMMVKASDLEGHRVLDENGKDVAKLHSMYVDTHSGRLVYGILEMNKAPNRDKGNLNPVPSEFLQITSNEKVQESQTGAFAKDAKVFKVVLGTTVEKIDGGPRFPEREWPTMTMKWTEEVYGAYGLKPFWAQKQHELKRAE